MPVEGLQIRRAEPDDCSAIYEMFSCPKVFAGTLYERAAARNEIRYEFAGRLIDCEMELAPCRNAVW